MASGAALDPSEAYALARAVLARANVRAALAVLSAPPEMLPAAVAGLAAAVLDEAVHATLPASQLA